MSAKPWRVALATRKAHAVMSLVTTTRDGHFNWFGRRYWPLYDAVREFRMRRKGAR